MTLANDACRCSGLNCGQRESCARFVLRETGGDRTPHTDRACGLAGGLVIDGFIKMEAE